MSSMPTFIATENRVHHRARAKYVPLPGGGFKLAQIQYFNEPRFAESGWEIIDNEPKVSRKGGGLAADGGDGDAARKNLERASRRAKINAFDAILCNHDLDTFATFTYCPKSDLDKASYDECYNILKPWLSNRVQRRGLKYVIVPERHKKGDIHFHGIMNSDALKLTQAYSPKTGRALTKNGSPIFNIADWGDGFTTAQIIGSGEDDREKVAKYVFKYMGKQLGERIGGRYALIGGDIVRPAFVYGDSIEELIGLEAPVFERTVDVTDKLSYKELSFV